jgi:hypothetical protein
MPLTGCSALRAGPPGGGARAGLQSQPWPIRAVARKWRNGLRQAQSASASVNKNPEVMSFIQPLRRPGDFSGVAAPDPIPNSAVKRPSADGTPSQDAGE